MNVSVTIKARTHGATFPETFAETSRATLLHRVPTSETSRACNISGLFHMLRAMFRETLE